MSNIERALEKMKDQDFSHAGFILDGIEILATAQPDISEKDMLELLLLANPQFSTANKKKAKLRVNQFIKMRNAIMQGR